MIKYLGSKRRLLPSIVGVVRELGARSAVDLFSGTSRVGHALKAAGLRVIANDHNRYAETLGRCYVATDADRLPEVERLVAELGRLPGRPGYLTRTFCEEARFFRPENGARIDAIRAGIAARGLDPELEATLLVSLMEAADRVDSTTGVQMAYLKQWAPRAHKPLELRVPALLPRAAAGKGEAYGCDAVALAGEVEADLFYLDPPYNQHRYIGNYHVWETLIRGDEPECFGVARKRLDSRAHHSAFNTRRDIAGALRAIVRRARARWLLVSFSNEGFLSRPELEGLLAERGPVRVIEHDHPRYVGARIGIYNPAGEKVGKIGHLANKEYLYLVEGGPPG